jgi:hypothetical protein
VDASPQAIVHRIEQIVEVAVDLTMAVEDEMGGPSVCWPLVEEIQRGREIAEPERVLHRSLLGRHVVEVGQRLEVGTEAFNGEALLERRPSQPQGMLGLSGAVKRVEVDALPIGIGTIPSESHKVVQIAAPGRVWAIVSAIVVRVRSRSRTKSGRFCQSMNERADRSAVIRLLISLAMISPLASPASSRRSRRLTAGCSLASSKSMVASRSTPSRTRFSVATVTVFFAAMEPCCPPITNCGQLLRFVWPG